MNTETEQARAWARQWRAAAAALAERRELELRVLTPAQALAASEALLALADPARLSSQRWKSSGLVDEQAALRRCRP
jgi:hypothetical protein